MSAAPPAAYALAAAIAELSPAERIFYLHATVQHAVGGLVVMLGEREVAGQLYRMADALAVGAPP